MACPTNNSFPTVNQVAFVTATTLAIGTAGTAFAAATVASTVATVAYTVLAITLGGLSIASVTAWFDDKSKDASSYLNTMKAHSGVALVGIYQFAAQTMLQALIQGLAEGIGAKIRRRISGPDVTVG